MAMAADLLLQTMVNAVYAASFMALIAVGLVLIFGVMGVINFAHGGQDAPFLLAVALGLVLVGGLGLVAERALFRPLRDNPLGGLIVSIGLLLVLQAAIAAWFGVRSEHMPPPYRMIVPLTETVGIPLQRLLTILAAVLLLGGLWFFLKRTRLGIALRACAQDPEAASLQGISIDQTSRIAMGVGAALAGVAGALTAPLVRTYPHMGHSVIVTAFIVIIVGGMGSLEGAVIAAILYAFLNTFVTTFADGVTADIVGLLLMLLVLIVRPQGLFGKPDRA
jgi:branched-chain amino acid transport system permease protein